MVAVPCRLLLTATPISSGTGLIFSLSARLKATGATSRTTATFSTKMEITPESAHKASMATRVERQRSTSHSAITAGTRESRNISARISVPKKSPMTFQLIFSRKASRHVSEVVRISSSPPAQAVHERRFGRATNRT